MNEFFIFQCDLGFLLHKTLVYTSLVVLGDAQNALSVRSKIRLQIWTQLGYLPKQFKVHQCLLCGQEVMAHCGPSAPKLSLGPSGQGATMVTPKQNCHVGHPSYPFFHHQKKNKNTSLLGFSSGSISVDQLILHLTCV